MIVAHNDVSRVARTSAYGSNVSGGDDSDGGDDGEILSSSRYELRKF